MARKLRPLGQELAVQIEEAWKRPQEDWARKRLLVVRLIALHELRVAQIMKVAGVCQQTVFTYRDRVVEGGVEALLKREWGGGPSPTLRGTLKQEFVERLEFRQAGEAQAWIKKRTRKTLTQSGVRKILRRLGGRPKVPRKTHAKKDRRRRRRSRRSRPASTRNLSGRGPGSRCVCGCSTSIVTDCCLSFAGCGRAKACGCSAPYATRYKWGYLHEALEVDGAHDCQLLRTPAIDQDIHALFLKQIAESDPESLHVVMADQAGFHLPGEDARVPANMKLPPLPPYSPELNPVERFAGLIKAAVSNRLYPTLDKLERHVEAVARNWSGPEKVAGLTHEWLAAKANCGAPA